MLYDGARPTQVAFLILITLELIHSLRYLGMQSGFPSAEDSFIGRSMADAKNLVSIRNEIINLASYTNIVGIAGCVDQIGLLLSIMVRQAHHERLATDSFALSNAEGHDTTHKSCVSCDLSKKFVTSQELDPNLIGCGFPFFLFRAEGKFSMFVDIDYDRIALFKITF